MILDFAANIKPPSEGGGPNPPYGEDLFQHITGVHWPKRGPPAVGAIFASGDVCCFLRASNGGFRWQGLGPNAFTSHGSCLGASYGKAKRPTWLICGMDGGSDGQRGSGLIVASFNGFSFFTSHYVAGGGSDGGESSSVDSLYFDAKAKLFFAAVNDQGDEYTLTSSDGLSWGGAGGFGMPGIDGINGYDPYNKIFITPGMVPVIDASCVAYAGGIWVAGGGSSTGEGPTSATAASYAGENGPTGWSIVSMGPAGNEEDFAVTCVCGGPVSDFRGVTSGAT